MVPVEEPAIPDETIIPFDFIFLGLVLLFFFVLAQGLLQAIALGVEDFDFAEEGCLGFDLRAVASKDDLQVRGIKIFAGSCEQLFGGNGADLGAIGFEVIVGQFVLGHVRELAEQTVLRRES